MNRTASILLLSLALIATGSYAGDLRVDRVVDGDTIYLSDGSKIRLYGIDAPERRQPHGLKARDALATMAAGPVQVQKMDVDRYGRTVAVVWIDGRNVNRELVEMGAAWVYDRYCKADFCDAWDTLEDRARTHRRGLWADPDALEPWKWRRKR
jgi:endonuclease YncB( thermonuclease family)